MRVAAHDDLPKLIEMGRAAYQESPRYRAFSFNEHKIRRFFNEVQNALLIQYACIYVAETKGEIIGMIICALNEPFFSYDKMVTDLLVYVQAEHRGSFAFVKLIRALERWAKKQGDLPIAIGVSSEIHAEKTVKLYQRLGYRLTGYLMVKDE